MIFLNAETASSNEGEAAILVDPGDDGVAELEEGAGVQNARVRLGLPADPPPDPPRLEEGADQVKEGTSLLNADGLAFLPPSENVRIVREHGRQENKGTSMGLQHHRLTR